jgi:ADP-L-glycero-D-manno-heptose 6-epimerase
MPESLKDKYQYFTEADMSWITKEEKNFDFKFRPLEDSVKDYIGYLKKNTYL